MTAYTMTKLFYISIRFWFILGVKSYDFWSKYILTVHTGGSVTIPCHYDKKYTQQKKYWFSEIDKSNTYTNTTEENLSVIDHPDQSLFTVTMRNLQNKHTGDYYCVVETGEQSPINITYEPYLKIQSVPDVSVIYSKPEDPVIYSTINDDNPNDPNKNITTYSTIDRVPGSEAPPAGGTIYSTVAPHQQQQ
ncbi:CMRF35-like molecule 6 isoform X3 [Onychostoma macrolepis]|uniref:CMRF35-like molecule 6 isoform X3 n=1 Tax=Onychostoma macrolepis TaxID=369639 RepID=UPI00272C08A5|nr:CMRF35-like molecule 6 isoform X3 [Onychostoma macrolepis]